jgi:xanthine dehydrogenase accessory factor
MSTQPDLKPANPNPIALVKGAGDVGTGVAYRLWKAGLRVVCTDLEKPLVIRRTVAFAAAIYTGRISVEGVVAARIRFADEAVLLWSRDTVPVIADPEAHVIQTLHPQIVVDCVLAKRNTGTKLTDAKVVVACGPGFEAGVDCHAVIETKRGHDLGRVLWSGKAEPNTGVPGKVGGADAQRVVRAPVAGQFYGRKAIGDVVKAGDVIATVGTTPVPATLGGVLRGLLHDDVAVSAGMKVGDIDPRAEVRYCFTISDKALAIGGGVLEAVFSMRERWG